MSESVRWGVSGARSSGDTCLRNSCSRPGSSQHHACNRHALDRVAKQNQRPNTQKMSKNIQNREETSIQDHHRKNIFWGTFLASKKNFPGRWWIRKHTTTIFPLWPQLFLAKKSLSSSLEQGGVCFLFPSQKL